jgi:hypothetical protein
MDQRPPEDGSDEPIPPAVESIVPTEPEPVELEPTGSELVEPKGPVEPPEPVEPPQPVELTVTDDVAPVAPATPAEPTRAELEAKIAQLSSELETARSEGPPRHPVRTTISWILLVLASLGIVASTLAVWVHETLFDTDRFMAVVEPVLRDPAVDTALATRLGDQVVAALDPETRVNNALDQIQERLANEISQDVGQGGVVRTAIEQRLSGALDNLGASIAGAVEGALRSAIDAIVGSDQFENLLVEVTARAQPRAAALLRGDYDQLPNTVVAEGKVTINLLPPLAEALRNVAERGLDLLGIDATIPTIVPGEEHAAALQKLSAALGFELPPDFGQITVMDADTLAEYQAVVRTFDRLVWLLVVITILLMVAAVLVAVRRLPMIGWVALGAVVALLLTGLSIRLVESRILEAFTQPEGQAAAAVILDQLVGSLRSTGIVVAVVFALIGIAILVISLRRRTATA